MGQASRQAIQERSPEAQEKLGLFRNGVLTEIIVAPRAVAQNRIIGLMNSGDDCDWEIYPV